MTLFEKRKIREEQLKTKTPKPKSEKKYKAKRQPSLKAKYTAEYYKAKRDKNIEREREHDRKRKQRERDKNKERVNAYQRERYKADPDGADKQNKRRQKREPHRLIRASTKLLSQGAIGIDEYLKRVGDAVAYSEQITVESPRGNGRSQEAGSLQHRASEAEHELDSKVDPDKS